MLLSQQAIDCAARTNALLERFVTPDVRARYPDGCIEEIALSNQETILRCLAVLLEEQERRQADSKLTDEMIARAFGSPGNA